MPQTSAPALSVPRPRAGASEPDRIKMPILLPAPSEGNLPLLVPAVWGWELLARRPGCLPALPAAGSSLWAAAEPGLYRRGRAGAGGAADKYQRPHCPAARGESGRLRFFPLCTCLASASSACSSASEMRSAACEASEHPKSGAKGDTGATGSKSEPPTSLVTPGGAGLCPQSTAAGNPRPGSPARRVPRASPAGSICTQRWGRVRAAGQGCQPRTASCRHPAGATPELGVRSGKPSRKEGGDFGIRTGEVAAGV